MKEILLGEMTWKEVKEYLKECDIILLPFGSTEQHGHHLPLGVDTYIPLWICKEVSKKTGTVVAPPLWFSSCEWHMNKEGTISLRTRTLLDITFDICDSLYHHGFRNFVCVNGHTSGSNPQLLCAADEIQKAHVDAKFWIADPVMTARKTVLNECKCKILGHAEEVEASQMLVARPELVHLEKSKANLPEINSKFIHLNYRENDGEILFRMSPNRWDRVAHDGHIGDPTIATRQKGEIIMNACVDNICTFIKQIKYGDLV